MKNILQITGSINGENSFSTRLSAAISEKITADNPGASIRKHDLNKQPPPHLTDAHFAAFLAAPETRTERQTADVRYSDEAISELIWADAVVLGVPLYNFSIPSTLKSWIDHIVRAGITFRYTPNGPEGLVKNKRVFLALSSGGIYSEGAMKPYDFAEPYLRAALGFLGMTDVTAFRVEGVKIPGVQESAFEKAVEAVGKFDFAADAKIMSLSHR